MAAMTRSWSPLSAPCLAAAILCAFTAAAPAQSVTLRNDPAVVGAFKSVVARSAKSTVRILCDGKEAALGTIVSAEGLIVTKDSELKGAITCKLPDGKTVDARKIGVEKKYDLAMLSVKAAGLQPIEWADSKSALVGNWLASSGTGEAPVAIGVVSVASRKPPLRDMPGPTPPPDSGYLGIGLEDGDGAPVIGSVSPRSAAAKAGLKVGDMVLAIQGAKVSDGDRLVSMIQRFKVGDVIKLEIKRGQKVEKLEVTLGKRPRDMMGGGRAEFQNRLGSSLSNRRGGFPAILQHDQVIKPSDCGGPVVGLDGKAVGVNIARAGRVESYAIPSEDVRALLNDLKSGKLAPKPDPVEIAELEAAVKKARKALENKEKDHKAAETERVVAEKAAKEKPTKEAEKALADVTKRSKGLSDEVAGLKKQLADVQKKLDEARGDATKR
jgi:serine protease Do